VSARRTLLAIISTLSLPIAATAQQAPAVPVTDWAALKAESEARKAAADARKAEAEADAAAAKAKFGPLADASTTGTTAAGDKAGQIEASILATTSTRSLAQQIVGEVCAAEAAMCAPAPGQPAQRQDGDEQPAAPGPAPGPPDVCGSFTQTGKASKLYIVTEAEKLNFDTAETVQASLCGIQRKIDAGIASSVRLTSGAAVPAIAPAAILTVLSVVGNLFRSDYTVQGIAITPDDLLLAKTVAAAARGRVTVPTLIPSIYRPAALTSDNPIVMALDALGSRRTRAEQLAATHRKTAAALTKMGKPQAGAAKANSDVAAQLDAAVKALEDYLAKLGTPDEKGTNILAEAARQSRMRSDLQAGAHLLTVKMNAAGGSSYTTKNFWTFLGGVPFRVSGGATASYTLIAGDTGEVRAAGAYGVAGGFQTVGAVHRRRGVQ